MDSDDDHLPRLSVALSERVLTRAPQPLADATALLQAARSAAQAQLAALKVVRAAARLLGLLALAARARDSRTPDGDSSHEEPINVALRRLRREPCSAADWLELARILTLPFAQQPEAHPVTELVQLLSDPGSLALLQRLTTLACSPDSGSEEEPAAESGEMPPPGPTSQPAGEVAPSELVAELDRMLDALGFLYEYRVVARRNGRNEAFVGIRRMIRARARIKAELDDGSVVLGNQRGEAVLTLDPLCQVLTPTPGALPELFLFDGPSRFGARLVQLPLGFVRHDNELWAWYRRNLLDGGPITARLRREDPGERVPYKGLLPFWPRDADNYFGREREVEASVNRLQIVPLLAVVGPSGAGKSSFVQAGIVAALPASWRAITVRPGRAPLAQLAARLAQSLDKTLSKKALLSDLRSHLERDIRALGRALRSWAQRKGVVLLVIVDQFEELLALCPDPHERALYTKALMSAAQSAEDPVRVVLTLRDDFLARAQQLPMLRDRLSHSLQLLTTPPPDQLEHILIEPARRARYDFEDPALPGEMVAEVANEPNALALLSFTASKLWELRDRQAGKLTRGAYETLGGVGGALAQHAEETLDNLPPEYQSSVREVFRQVVTAEGTRAILSRQELSQILGQDRNADAVIEALIKARLLVASKAPSGADRIEVVHEALLLSWPRLVTWQREDAESVRLRDQLRGAARQWDDRGQTKGLLWRGDALLEYRVWRARYRGRLTETEEAFARASLRAETRGRWLRGLILLAVITTLSVALLVVFQQRQRADSERVRAQEMADKAQERMSELYLEQGRQRLVDGDPTRALLYLREARASGTESPAIGFMLDRAVRGLDGQLAVFPGHDGFISWLEISPDGKRIATAGFDQTVRVWNLDSGTVARNFDGYDERVWMVDFSSDGAYLATTSHDGMVKVWSLGTGDLAWSARHGDRAYWVGYNADGTILATTSSDGTARLWNAQNGAAMAVLEGHESWVTIAAWGPESAYLVTGSIDESVRIWNTSRVVDPAGPAAARAEPIAAIAAHHRGVGDIQISPDGSRIVTADRGNTARLLSPTGEIEARLVGHTQRIVRARFSPDSARVVTASNDSLAKVWDAETGAHLLTLGGHASGLTFAGYAPDGGTILTTGRDGTARTWDPRTGALQWTHIGHEDAIWIASFLSSGERFLTAAADGTAREWSTGQTGYQLALHHLRDLRWATMSPVSSAIATVTRDGAITVWDRQGNRTPLLPGAPGINRVAWSPDGSRLVACAGQSMDTSSTSINRAIVLDASTGERLFTIEGHKGQIFSAFYSPDGNRIVTASDDGTAKLWRAEDGELTATLPGHDGGLLFAEFDPSSSRIVTASSDRTARIWTLEPSPGGPDNSAENHRYIELRGHTLGINSARFSPDGSRVVTAGRDKRAKIWTADGALQTTLEGHGNSIEGAVFNADGTLVATAGYDGELAIWDAGTGAKLWSTALDRKPVSSVELAPDGRHVLTASGSFAALWDISYRKTAADAASHYATCRVGYTLEKGRLKRRAIDHLECGEQR